jgi:hypothetical protein
MKPTLQVLHHFTSLWKLLSTDEILLNEPHFQVTEILAMGVKEHVTG